MTFINRPEWMSPWNESGSDSTWPKYRLMMPSRLRCAIRSEWMATETLARIPARPTANQMARSCPAWLHTVAAGSWSELDSIPITRPNSTGSKNCSPATIMLAPASMTASRVSLPSEVSTRR